jgi:hypothetical protein
VDEEDSFTWWNVTVSRRSGCYRGSVLLVVWKDKAGVNFGWKG